MVQKSLVAAAVLAALGPPIVELWEAVVLVAAWLAIATGRIRLTRGRLAGCLAALLAVLLIRTLLPRAAIQEGHNIFLVTGESGVLETGLPAAVYREWRRAFEQQYPADQHPKAPWRPTPPLTLYASSSDALWRPARYSRVVDAIAFDNLTEFRGGFSNDKRYNFFGEDPISLARNFQADLPFFVMYEFSPASVGSTLRWRGTFWWERSDGTFEAVQHSQPAGRTITAADVARKAFALHLPAVVDKPWLHGGASPTPEALAVRLIPSRRLAVAQTADRLLGLLAVVAILLTTEIAWRHYAAAAGLTAIGGIIVALIILFSQGKYLGPGYPPHGGGDDGLSHESKGRIMAMKAMRGDVAEALRGEESVFYDTPGMRYARFLEKIVVGDTNLGYGALIALLPWFVYLLIRQLGGLLPAIAGTAFFLLCPTGSLSFAQYIQNAKLGYAEAAGFGALILGASLLVQSQPAWGGRRSRSSAFVGGACLACAFFLRPNLALASLVLGGASVVVAWRDRDPTTVAAAAAGLAIALWMPVHNYLYGGEFVLMTQAGATISLPLSPLTYLKALGEIAIGRWGGEYVTLTATQVTTWLGATPRFPVAFLARLSVPFLVFRWLTLAVTVAVAVRIRHGAAPCRVLAWAALASLVPMLFAFAPGQFRYAMIGWDLCAIVTLVSLVHASRPRVAEPALTWSRRR